MSHAMCGEGLMKEAWDEYIGHVKHIDVFLTCHRSMYVCMYVCVYICMYVATCYEKLRE